jgi:hypothetical protein
MLREGHVNGPIDDDEVPPIVLVVTSAYVLVAERASRSNAAALRACPRKLGISPSWSLQMQGQEDQCGFVGVM